MLAITLLILMCALIAFFVGRDILEKMNTHSDYENACEETDIVVNNLRDSEKKALELVEQHKQMPGDTYPLRVQKDNFERDVVIPAIEEWKSAIEIVNKSIENRTKESDIAIGKEKVNLATVGALLAYTVYLDSKE